MTLTELRDKINKLGTDMSDLMKKAREEARELTADEERSFDAIDTDREKLLATEKRQRKIEELEAPAGRAAEHMEPEHRQAAQPSFARMTEAEQRQHNVDRAEAMRAWFLAGSDQEVTAQQRQIAQRMGVPLDRKQMRIRLAPVAPTSLRAQDMRDWEARYLGVDTISPDNGGHFAVPNEAMRSLETAMLAFGGMRQVATVLRTGSGADLPMPTMNDTANEGAILGESSLVTELDPTLNQLVLQSYKYTSRLILVSVEYMQDNAINAAEVIGRLLGERIARITNRHFTVGTGSSQPNGIVTAATSSGVTTAAASTISYNDIIDLKHSVDPAYRNNGARFMFHDNLLKALKKIKVPQFSGDTAGYPLWKAGMASGDPDTIDGDPYVINQHMPLITAGLKAAVYGDLSKYQVRDVRDVTLLRLDERYAEYHQVAFLAFSRHDGDLLDAGTHPVKYLTMGA